METIRNYLETMFQKLPNTPEVKKAKYELGQMMEDKYTELKNEGKTIILSTHIFSLVEKLCDRVGIIIDGKMVVSDTLENITKDKNLEDAFFDLYFAKGGVLNE